MAAEAARPAAGDDRGRPARQGLRTLDLVALGFAAVAVGVAVSAIMVDIGTSGPVVMAAAVLAFSGTGELAYASVIASGGGMGPALVAALLVSSRFGLLAMSMMGRWPAPLGERLGIAHVASEPAVAASLEAAERGRGASRRAFWQVALWMSAGWVAGSALGLALGNLVGDTQRIGLDAVFPASLVGAMVLAFRRRDSLVAVALGGAAAVALTPFLPAGAPILVAALAAPVAMLVAPRPLGGPPPSAEPVGPPGPVGPAGPAGPADPAGPAGPGEGLGA